ncbi:glycoside hydrolase family 97 catalytic domain-containing protein [Herbiconiux solani]|uniref:glycoside hydrolase family 97 catalytic domain-containing protein n=1 Tax=Herbiconiux solani TaxID=661329 RepID=UPI001470D9F0|nr:glycoside hydrolase family 97 catalytic domain-containing protein [Herbiconiux solani]
MALHLHEVPALSITVGGHLCARIELGLTVDGVPLGRGSELLSVTRRHISDSYRAFTGKTAGERMVEHDEAELWFEDVDGRRWGLLVRSSHDGVAFRYRLPYEAPATLGAEATRIAPVSASRAWVLDYQTWYETPRFGADLDELAAGDYGFPILVAAHDDRFFLLTESDIDGRSSGAHARFSAGSFSVVTADDELAVDAGYQTPWRVLIIGSLADIVASTMVDDLAPAADSAAVVVPRPGRAAWSWWSSQYSGAYLDVQKRFTDFAAEQGWEHVLVDCGWDASWMPELVSYASARGIQVHVWSSWSDLDGDEALRKLALWRSWGVAGIKVDFMESESRDRYRWYDAIIAETARVGLMVNFHGSVIPRGWARTFPHVVSYEGIRGAEYYVFYGDPLTAAHNVIQPFTRNIVGAMDYTPVTFSAPQRETTDAHELALGVVYESGITHFADDPDQYRARPHAARFLAELPATWDEVRLISGTPDTEAVIARRSGDRWFLGGISCTPAHSISFPLGDLIAGPSVAWVVTDGPGHLVESWVDGPGDVAVVLEDLGGFAAIVAPTGTQLHRATARAEQILPQIEPPVLVLNDSEPSSFKVSAHATLRTPPGWAATPANDGITWWVQRPDSAEAGDLVVFAAEAEGPDGVPLLSHAKVLIPYAGDGGTDLSDIPFLDAANEVGPVERNLSNGGGDPRDGGPLTVGRTQYTHGLGVSQNSRVMFALDAAPSLVSGSVGIDDETPGTQAGALILLDGIEQARFVLQAGAQPHPFQLDCGGASVLELRTFDLPGRAEAHVDWLDLRLTRA